MRFRFVNIVVLLVLILSPVAIPADEREPSSSRWGITTKKDLDQSRITEEIVETKSGPEEAQAVTPAQPTDQEASSPSVNTDVNVKIDPTQQPSPDKQDIHRQKPYHGSHSERQHVQGHRLVKRGAKKSL